MEYTNNVFKYKLSFSKELTRLRTKQYDKKVIAAVLSATTMATSIGCHAVANGYDSSATSTHMAQKGRFKGSASMNF